jgi:hypothetical protein
MITRAQRKRRPLPGVRAVGGDDDARIALGSRRKVIGFGGLQRVEGKVVDDEQLDSVKQRKTSNGSA